MSLLDQLRSKKKGLRPSETVVTNFDGSVHLERSSSDGSTIKTSLATRSPGFVVDLKPDLTIGLVLPNLGVSSQDVALDSKILRDNFISHILSVGVDVPHIGDITYKYLDLYDLPETRLEDVLPECLEFIETGMSGGGHVLVHCNAGVSRSCSIVLAYLMSRGSTYEQAFERVCDARPVAKPNEGFVKQLKELEKNLTSDGRCSSHHETN